MVQLAAVDMDGTLLNEFGKITDGNIAAIKKFQDHGADFMICTGRDYADAKLIVEEAGIHCGYICLSGAAVYDKQGTQLLNLPLDAAQLLQLGDFFLPRHIGIDLLSANGRYTTCSWKEKLEDFCWFLSKGPLSGMLPEVIREAAEKRIHEYVFLDDFTPLLDKQIQIYKVCANQLLPHVVDQLKEDFLAYPQFAVASSFPTNIEITDIKAQKGLALKTYADLNGIPMDHVMAIGDSDNDLSMISMDFGYTVAMDNAMSCIKQAAKYHTKSNKEDGVAWAIHQYAF